VYSLTVLRNLIGVRPFKDDNEITLTAVGFRWGWEIKNASKSSKPAKCINEGDTAISKFPMGTKVIKYHSFGFSVSSKSKPWDTISYDYITVSINSFQMCNPMREGQEL